MPKASKKKTKQADFEKTRTKLGKKQVASNATDTSFKARSIALPSQSINADKTAVLTTRRNKTIEDLLGMLRHTTAGFRKDALLGLRELLTLHPSLIRSSIGTVIPNLNRLIIDDDVGVRRSLHSFLEWFLPLVPSNVLLPYRPNLLLYTTSAMSHIYADIRMDAVRILDLLLDVIPDAVTEGWKRGELMDGIGGGGTAAAGGSGSASSSALSSGPAHGKRVLRCYLTLLLGAQVAQGASNKPSATSAPIWGAAASSDLSMQSKQTLLSSLQTFVERGSPSSSSPAIEETATSKGKARESEADSSGLSTASQWYFLPSFASQSHAEAFLASLKPWEIRQGSSLSRLPGATSDEVSAHLAEGGLIDVDATAGLSLTSSDLLQALSGAGASARGGRGLASTSSSSAGTPHLSLFLALSSTLINILLDAAPSAFGPESGGPDTGRDVEACRAVGGLSRALWRGAIHEVLRLRSSGSTASKEDLQAATLGVEQLEKLLNHMSAYFPFATQALPGAGVGSRKPNAKDQATERLNLDFCELAALRDLVDEGAAGKGQSGSGSKGKKAQAREARLAKVSKHLVRALLGDGAEHRGGMEYWTAENADDAVAKAAKSRPAPVVAAIGTSTSTMGAEEYRSVLPIVWLILNKRRDAEVDGEGTATSQKLQALMALLEHWRRSKAHEETKKQATLFLSTLLLIPSEPSYAGNFSLDDVEMMKALRIWVCELPRYLFELGTGRGGTDERIIEAVLELLRRLAMQDAPRSVDGRSSANGTPLLRPSERLTLQRLLAPFFFIHKPPRSLAGPYSKLSEEGKRRAKGVIHYLEPIEDQGLSDALTRAGIA